MEARYCPRCRQPLHEARGRLMALDMCITCGGAYFDHGELATLARKHFEQFGKLEALVEPREVVVDPAGPPSNLRCPGCASPMATYEYAGCSDIRLDRCPKCFGVWADEGELKAVGEHLTKGHEILTGAADSGASALGPVPEAQPELSAERWRSVGAVATLVSRHVPARPQ